MGLLWPYVSTKCFFFFLSATFTKGNMIITNFLREFCNLERCVGRFVFQFHLLREAGPMGWFSLCTSYLFEPCGLFQLHFIKVEQSEICTVCMSSVSDKGQITAIRHMIWIVVHAPADQWILCTLLHISICRNFICHIKAVPCPAL